MGFEVSVGTGKTFVAISLLHEYLQNGKRCLVIVPSIVLFHQWKEEIERELDFELTSLLGAGHQAPDLQQPITLGVLKSVATAARNGKLSNVFSLLIADECHRFASDSHRLALVDDINNRLGLTATLERSDDGVGEILTPYFAATKRSKHCICFRYGFGPAKQDEVIAPFITLSIGVDLDDEERRCYDKCAKRMADGRKRLISEFGYPRKPKQFMTWICTKRKTRSEGILANMYLSGMNGKRRVLAESRAKAAFFPELAEVIGNSNGTLVYVETVQAAEDLASSLSDCDFQTESFHSKLSAAEREEIFERFRSKETLCLTAVHCLDEGINVPDANCAVIVASTKQRRQMIQRMGRVLRLKYDETGAVVVHVYARQTPEDPTCAFADDEYYLSMLTKEAYGNDRLDSEDYADYDVMKWIRDLVNWTDCPHD